MIGWFWDNHHHHRANFAVAEAVDVAIPGHGFCKDYLACRESRLWEPLPLCVTQWSRDDVGDWFESHGVTERSPALYGGFVDYSFEPARRRFLEAMMAALPDHALSLLDESRMRDYFGRPEEERFAEWCAHRTSLVLPLRRDLSQRVFDALLAGQIPLVPVEIEDFDAVIPPALQQSLPVMRFTMADPGSALAAQAAALAAFEAGGVAAARARHVFARDGHMISARVNAIIARALDGATLAPQPGFPEPAISRPRRRLFIDAQHGLGNRLRAIGSAAQIAARTGRELVIVWRPDHHCDCRFGALFDYPGVVIEDDAPEAAAARGSVVHNYMEAEPDGRKDAPIMLDHDRDVYVRSAFVLNSPLTDWEGQNVFLRSLPPAKAVRALVDSVKGPFDLSVHVRMEGGRKDEGLPYESPENWTARDHALIDEWRARSQPARFLARVDALLAAGAIGALFLAADSPEAYAAFGERYGDRLRRLERTRYDRSAEQLRYALADAILVGRAPRMLGSTWSSFSELATRLAPGPIRVEMSGKDF